MRFHVRRILSLNMEKIQRDPTEQVLSLTLEIILLLTGEDYFVVKKPGGGATNKSLQVVEGSWKARTDVHIPLPRSVIHEPNKKKILHLTNKMIELLTEEVPLRYEDITVSFSMEEWEYIEGHKDLYKDVLMDDHWPLTSPDLPKHGSSEDPPMQIMEERNGETITTLNIYTPTGHIQETPPPIKEEPVSRDGRNLTGPTQQYLFIPIKEEPHPCDGAILTDPNIYVRQYPCTSVKEEPSSCDGDQKNPPLDQTRPYPPSHINNEQDGETVTNPNIYVIEDHTQHCSSPQVNEEPFRSSGGNHLIANEEPFPASGGNHLIANEEPFLASGGNHLIGYQQPFPSTGGNLLGYEEPFPSSGGNFIGYEEPFPSSRGNLIGNKEPFPSSGGNHLIANEEPFPSSRGNLIGYEEPFPSSVTHVEEGTDLPDTNPPETQSRTNDLNRELVSHQGIHLAGKVLQSRTYIFTTTIVHVPQVPPVKHKLLTCATCGRTFYTKSSLVGHMKTHWGKVSETFKCDQCGKCFSTRSLLNLHSRLHCGDRPYACSTCGERFMRTSGLGRHQSKHR